MSLVWERAPYTAGSLIVLLALADWANDEGVAWPSMDRLAQKARIDRRSAQRIVRQLAKDGVLEIEEGGGRSKQHRYVLKMETAALSRPLFEVKNGDILNIETAAFDPERATSDPQRATFDAETVTPTSPDPLEEPSDDPLDDPPNEPLEARAAAKKKLGQLSEEEFLSRLENDPAFAGIDVRRLNSKMILWCEVNGKRPTRRRLVNWLNREDRPMENGNGNGTNQKRFESSPERNARNLRENGEYIRRLQNGGSEDNREDPISLLTSGI
jgi:hypothetical protein